MMNLRAALEPLVPSMQTKAEAGSTGVSYGASALAFLGGTWTKNELMALGGLLFVALTYFTSLYFQRRRDKRDQEIHQIRIDLERKHYEQKEAPDSE